MIYNDNDKFSKLVDRIASQTGFYVPLMEKDYYLTLLLSRINESSEDLESFAKQFGMRVEGVGNAGRNESKQYIYYAD